MAKAQSTSSAAPPVEAASPPADTPAPDPTAPPVAPVDNDPWAFSASGKPIAHFAREHSHIVIDKRGNEWHVICGPGPRCGGEIAAFPTRDECVQWCKKHGIAVSRIPSLGIG